MGLVIIIVTVWSVRPVYYLCCVTKAGKLCYNVILFLYKDIFTIKMPSVWGVDVCVFVRMLARSGAVT